MKFSLSLLNKYFNFNKQYTANELAEIITNLGFEVEEVQDLSLKYKNFIVANVVETKKHPESEKLNLCKVNTGTEILDIVCGGRNVRGGLNIILAKIGAIVPVNGMEIKKGVIRGEKSEGMICSAEELCLPDDGIVNGIMELPSSTKIGIELAEYLGVKDFIFQISITPNRGDGASIKGILRDLEAKGIGTQKQFFEGEEASYSSFNEVIIEEELKNKIGQVNFAKASLDKAKFNTEGIDLYQRVWGTSGFFPVDLSNFMMFVLGTPTHIYDASKIDGKITVSRSRSGEIFLPIKGEEITLPEGLVVVRDENKILSLLGIMGDARSKFTETTKEVVIEAIHINADEIIKSSKATGIKSDSSYRFERGVDFTLQNKVIKTILTKLGVIDFNLFHWQGSLKTSTIKITTEDYKSLIGTEISLNQIKQTLQSLEYKIEEQGKALICTIPPFKSDITTKQAICGEIARIVGFESIKQEAIAHLKPIKNYNLSFEIKKILQTKMREVITYSFFMDEYFGLFSSSNNKIRLQNPITQELSTMRDSLIPNLLENIANNEKKSYFNNQIFEVGTVFFGTDEEAQNLHFAGAFCGLKREKTFIHNEEPFTIWDAKSQMLEVLYEIWNLAESSFIFKPASNFNLHTTQGFEIYIGKNQIGILAQIHPLTLDKFEIKQKVFIFEIYTQSLPPIKTKKLTYKEDILPDVLREIAIIIDSKINFDKILNSIKKLRIEELKELNVKDVFESEERIGKGLKSLSLQFKIKQEEKTLTKEEIDDKIIGSIVLQLSKEFNAKLRDGETAK